MTETVTQHTTPEPGCETDVDPCNFDPVPVPIDPVLRTPLGTIPYVAAQIAANFAELQGRALPVIEPEITAENVPTLPLAMVSPEREDAEHRFQGNRSLKLVEAFEIEFWLKPERWKTPDGAESPFWAYYDIDTLRDRVILLMLALTSPRGGRFEYVSMSSEATQFAVIVTFKMKHHTEWCEPEIKPNICDGESQLIQDGLPLRLAIELCPDVTVDYNRPQRAPAQEDPCAPFRKKTP